MQQVFCNQTPTSPSVSATNYIHPNVSGYDASGLWSTSSTFRAPLFAQAGLMANLHVWLATAPGVGKSWVFTVQKNGVDTALTVTVTDAGVSASDNTHSFTIAAGDRISLKAVPSGTPAATGIFQWSLSFTGTAAATGAANTDPNSFFVLGGANGVAFSTAVEQFMCMTCELGFETPEADASVPAPLSGTLRRFNAAIVTAPGSGKSWTFNFYVNGSVVDTAVIADLATTVAATINVPFVQGDVLSIGILPSGTPAANTGVRWGLCVESAVAGESWQGGKTFDQTDSGSTEFNQLQGAYNKVHTGTEATFLAKCGAIGFALKKFYIKQFASVSGGSYNYTARKNGADTSLVATVSSGNSVGVDNSNSASYALNDTIAFKITPVSTPSTTATYDYSVVQYIAPKTQTPTETLTLTATLLTQKIKTLLATETLTLTDTFIRLTGKVYTEVLNLAANFTTPASSGTFRVASGTYTGNATDNRAITGLGFQPKLVIIKAITGGANDDPVMGWDNMGADNSFVVDPATAVAANLTQSFDSDGFTIGNANQVNANTVVYYWTAFGGDATSMFTGSYTGDAVDSRAITGVGFQPNVVFIKRSTAVTPFFRFSTMSGDNSSPFSNAGGTVSNRIQNMLSDGFEIGTNAAVNASGGTYYYFCIKFPTGQGIAGGYTGNGSDNRAITTPAFLPSFVMIKADTTEFPVFRSTIHSGDDSSIIQDSGANAADIIQSLDATGFTIGTNSKVNTNAVPYFYIAMKDGGASQTKTLTETLTHTDTVVRTASKVYSEVMTLTDTVLKLPGKVLTESLSLVDQGIEIARVSILTLTDTITHTDTLIKMANKVLTQTLTLTDTIVRTLSHTFTETFTFLDTLLKQAGKVLTETLTHTDVFAATKVTLKTLTETLTLTDVFTRIWTAVKTLTETLTLTDTVLKRAGKVLTESVTFTDTFLRTFGKTLTESLTLTATIIRTLSKTFTQTLTLTDVFAYSGAKIREFTEVLHLTDTFIGAITAYILKRIGLIRGFKEDANTQQASRGKPQVGKKTDDNTQLGTRL